MIKKTNKRTKVEVLGDYMLTLYFQFQKGSIYCIKRHKANKVVKSCLNTPKLSAFVPVNVRGRACTTRSPLLYINKREFLFAHRVSTRAQIRRVNMKSMITLLFLAAVAVYARAEMEYHPQAILHYLEMEDRDMARKVRSFVKLNDFKPSFRPSIRPSGMPPMPPDVVSTHTFERKGDLGF